MTATIRARVVIPSADQPTRRDAVIELRDGRIAEIRSASAGDVGPIYDVVLPGLIDAHSHGRGLAVSLQGVNGGPLERFLLALRALTPVNPRDDALAAADDSLHTGITTVQIIHHSFASADAYAEQALAIADGCSEAGIRAFIALGLTDQDEYTPMSLSAAEEDRNRLDKGGLPVPQRDLTPERFPQVARELMGSRGLAQIDAVGPVAPQWCTDAALRSIATVGAARVHAHVLESPWQRIAAGHADPVQRLAEAGLLGPTSSFAHVVWPTDAQINQLAGADAVVVHNPGSNLRLGVGRCPVRTLLDAGVTVALGIDSLGIEETPDMFAEMRQALATAREAGAPLTAAQVLGMATAGGARALCRSDLGTLAPGAAADAIALTLPAAVYAADPVEAVVGNAGPADLAGCWVGGRPVRRATSVVQARERLLETIRIDAPRRAARLAMIDADWRTVAGVWREIEARTEVAM